MLLLLLLPLLLGFHSRHTHKDGTNAHKEKIQQCTSQNNKAHTPHWQVKRSPLSACKALYTVTTTIKQRAAVLQILKTPPSSQSFFNENSDDQTLTRELVEV